MMLKLFFSILAFSIHSLHSKETADIGEFPWTVSLRLSGLIGHDCGAAILDEVKCRQNLYINAKIYINYFIELDYHHWILC